MDFATFNKEKKIYECDNDSFSPNDAFCYKCDDKFYGNLGCDASKGCIYINANDELDCLGCKEGYFEYTKGQCLSCEDELENCGKCTFDLKNKFKCDNCLTSYIFNTEENICKLNECEEYPDISPGCIICKDQLDKYKNDNKCQMCKYGYFKNKNDGKCYYCRTEQYGGPFCHECGYDEDENGMETDNIICKTCYSADKIFENYPEIYNRDYYNFLEQSLNSFLYHNKKCYNCQNIISESCLRCGVTNEGTSDEKFVCTLCTSGYILNSNGKCISLTDKLETIKNCDKHQFVISNIIFYYYASKDNSFFQSDYYSVNYINKSLNIINTPIKTTCQDCLEGTFLNDDGECEILTPEKCNGYFIYKYSKRYVYTCRDICYKNEYPMIYFELGENSINVDNIDVKNMENKINIFFSLEYSLFSYDKETNNILLNSPMCYVLLDEEKTKFKKCIGVIQLKSGSYQCLQCKSGYNLDYDNNKCVSDLKFNHCEEDEKDNLTGNYK